MKITQNANCFTLSADDIEIPDRVLARDLAKEYERFGVSFLEVKNKVKVNNQNLHKSKEIELPEGIEITDVIINGETTILKDDDKKIILKKAKDDEYNIEYAFLYGYFLMNSGLSKTQASKFFKELREIVEDKK